MIGKLLTAVFAITISITPAYAVKEWTSWSGIKQIGMSVDGNMYMQLTSGAVNPGFCQFGSASQGLMGSGAKFREMYALLLSAQASNLQVSLYIDDLTCVNKRASIIQVYTR